MKKNIPDEWKELAEEIRAKQFSIDDDFSKTGIIAREINTTTWASFCRFGDRKNATKALILFWIRNDGIPLDVQAASMSEQFFTDVSPEELADFITQYDHGKTLYEDFKELGDLKKLFRKLTGLSYHSKIFQEQSQYQPQSTEEDFAF
jgi:2-hydroxy-3-keto-5-methylthiopentenyl-1-phosphate phosphatase